MLGPNPKSIIELITKDDFLKTVKQQALEWREWISHTKDSVAYQYYAVLTLCRAFYVLQNGEQTSKIKAGKWMVHQHPKWAPLINKAISKNHAKIEATDLNYQEVYNFTNEIISLIEKGR